MTHKHCATCDQIVENDLRNVPLTNTALADSLGTTESSIRRHRKHLSVAELSDVDPFFSDVPNAAITSRGKSIRTVDGSWEKVTWNPGIAALAEALEYDDIDRLLTETPPIKYADFTAVAQRATSMSVCVADLQVGKVDENGGSPALLTRFKNSLDTVVARALFWRPSEIVLWELGDVLEGFNNTAQQRETNDLDLVTQIRTARRLLADAIRALAPLCESLVLISVPSNHGAVRVGMGNKMNASTPNNDYGIEINHMLEDQFEGRPGYEHVTFKRPAGHAQGLVHLTADGTNVGAVHGHQANSSAKMGDFWKGQSHGRRDNLHEADILLFGHHHHFSLNQSGDSRWLIGAPSLDGGSAWYTSRTGESSESGILVFTTNSGRWERLEIV